MKKKKKKKEKQFKKITESIRNAIQVMFQEIFESTEAQKWVYLSQLFMFGLFQVVFIPWTVHFNQLLNTTVDPSELSELQNYFANKDVTSR